MAELNSSHGADGYLYSSSGSNGLTPAPKDMATLTNIAGAAVSLALVIGVGVWGYKLLVRDVSGIPVVQAAAGEMRVRPEEPGGQLAQHQGLSVNVVAAEGTAAAPADELRLAPKPVQLTAQDRVTPAAMVAAAPQDAIPATPEQTETPDVAAALQSGNVDDLVAQLTQGIAPLSDLAPAPTETEAAVVVPQIEEPTVSAGIDAPGVRQSLRPRKRPAQRAQVVPASLSVAAPATRDVDPASLPAGTRLAQLGAFDSQEIAYEQWDQLNQRFGAYLQGKKRVVQKAKSGGRVFYRLRAMGFDDIAQARQFCSALVAQNADCIPVVTR